MREITWFRLSQFNNDGTFPIFVQYGHHDEELGWHGHTDYAELVVVVSGTAKHLVLDKVYELGRGDVFVIPVGVTHSYRNAVDLRIINIMFDPRFQSEMMADMENDIGGLTGYRRLFMQNEHYINRIYFDRALHLDEGGLQRVIFACDNIIKESERKYPGWKTAVRAMFMYAVIGLSRSLSGGGHTQDTALAKIEDSRDFINYSFREKITVGGIAARTGYSARHFVRLFKESYGMSPSEYILDVRLRHACNLLKVTRLDISEVAAQSGFASPNYFSKFFKEKTGMTPKEYRRSES